MDSAARAFQIGALLTEAQADECRAAEAFRRLPTRDSREHWLRAVQTVSRLTTAYLDAATAFVDRGEPAGDWAFLPGH